MRAHEARRAPCRPLENELPAAIERCGDRFVAESPEISGANGQGEMRIWVTKI